MSVEILMKVAGHCTAIMTIYYQKYSIAHISELLTAADVSRMSDEQTNWERFIKSKLHEDLSALVAWNDATGLQSVQHGSGASWQRKDHGMCPVGGARCQDGGELIESAGPTPKYAPVQGGAQNCVRCRFFITGPAFLIGLQSFFNDTGYQYHLAGEKYREAEKNFLGLDFRRKQNEAAQTPFLDLRKWQLASSSHDQRLPRIE